MRRVYIHDIEAEPAQRFGGLPQECGLPTTLRPKHDDGKPHAPLSPLHHLPKSAVPIHKLLLHAGDKPKHNPPHDILDIYVLKP